MLPIGTEPNGASRGSRGSRPGGIRDHGGFISHGLLLMGPGVPAIRAGVLVPVLGRMLSGSEEWCLAHLSSQNQAQALVGGVTGGR